MAIIKKTFSKGHGLKALHLKRLSMHSVLRVLEYLVDISAGFIQPFFAQYRDFNESIRLPKGLVISSLKVVNNDTHYYLTGRLAM